jgi:signal peptidase I
VNTSERPDRDLSPLTDDGSFPTFSPSSFETVAGPAEAAGEGARTSRKPAPGKERSGLLEAFVLALIALVLALSLKTYVAEAYEIKGRSMRPTFLSGQRVVVLKTFYDVERYDIIVFSNDDNPYDKDPPKDLIKRVIGLPGDRVEVDHEGRVVLNGELLDEEYTMPPRYDPRDFKPNIVPEGHYFVLGDNRIDSHDSRDFDFPFVPVTQVRGKVVIRWWPFSELKTF